MNIVELFAKGGKQKTKSEAQNEGEIILNVLNAIGIDEEVANAKLNEIAQNNDVDTMNAISQAVGTIVQGQEDPSKKSDVEQAIGFLQETFGSQMFKCGGKMQKLASKIKKNKNGGDCGCKGTKIKKDGGKVNPLAKLPKK